MLKDTLKNSRSFFLTLSFVLCSASYAMSQNGAVGATLPDTSSVVLDYFKASVCPSFPGGEDKLVEFINRKLRFPAQSVENGVSGRVSVRFTIDKEGNIKNPRIIRSLDPYCDDEAIRVVKLMPKWTPGKDKDGKIASFYFDLPIIFKMAK